MQNLPTKHMDNNRNNSADRHVIVFDGRFIIDTSSGIGRYASEMLTRIPPLAKDISFHVLFSSAEIAADTATRCGFASMPNVSTEVVPYGPKSPKSQILLPKLLKSLGASIFHSPEYIMPYFPCGECKRIANIHDIIPIVVKDYAPNSKTAKFPLKQIYRNICIPLTLRKTEAIITGSQCTKKDLVRDIGLNECEAQKINVIFDGSCIETGEHTPIRSEDDKTSTRTIIYVGRSDPYKNVTVLVEAFAEIREKCQFPIKLRVIGKKDPRYPEAELRAKELGLSAAVEFTGFVTEEELTSAYRTADLLIHPSRYEGFGLEIVEAMSAGTPVICTDGGSQPEVAGDAAIVVPAGDANAITDTAIRVLTSPAMQKDLRGKGLKRAKLFTWDNTARETLELYRSILKKGGKL